MNIQEFPDFELFDHTGEGTGVVRDFCGGAWQVDEMLTLAFARVVRPDAGV